MNQSQSSTTLSSIALSAAIVLIASTGTALADGSASSNARSSYSNVMDFATGTPQAGGSSMLIRSSRGVSLSAQAAGLEPHSAYTVWWIIFNNPKACEDQGDGVPGCNGPDLGIPEVNGSVAWATGRVVDAHGFASFDAHLLRGGPAPGDVLFGPGLDSNGAEIHLVFRSHGPAATLMAAGELEAALTTVAGGCVTNACDDTHFATHLP